MKSEIQTIYLDHAASTPLRNEAYEAMLPYLSGTYGNAGSIHHVGRRAFDALEHARMDVASTLGVNGAEIIFTGSGTEANNLALVGTARAKGARGKHILVSAIEHKSVLETAESLRAEGFDIEFIPVDSVGKVSVSDILKRIRPDTILVSVMYANNEIGTIEPIAELGEALRKNYPLNGPLFHTDACQASGQLPINPRDLHVDLMTLNSSKVYGPKGIGLLYVREGVALGSFVHGGDQEHGKRAGTENVAGIVGFATALSLAEAERESTSTYLIELRDAFIREVKEKFPQAILNGHETERLPNNIHFSFPRIEGESLVLLLDMQGVCASTGSACNARDLAPSHVLRAIGQSHELIHGSLRLTLGRETTKEDLEKTLIALTISVERLESLSPIPKRI